MKTENNQKQIEQLKVFVVRNLKKMLHEGIYGEAFFRIKIQDGAIQKVVEGIEEEHKL